MHFYKYQALGNDYMIIDPKQNNLKLTEEIVKLLCNRNLGIGSDGVLYGPIFKNNQIYLKIFNPDGSIAEKSGNGVRIFSRYLYDAKYIKSKCFSLNTDGGIVKIDILNKDATLIKVNMGEYTFLSSKIPVIGENREVLNEQLIINGEKLLFTCVSVGNPHCVIPMKIVTKDIATSIGPLVETNSIFPNRTNVQFMQIKDRHNIKIEIWERGAGYTLASGSSSCAAACAAYRLGLVEKDITVNMPGGNIIINIDDKIVNMTGSVTGVFEGNFSKEFMLLLRGR